MKEIFLWLIFSCLSLFFCSCESQIAGPSGAGGSHFAQAPTDRPGLGTKWGETRRSRVELTSFRRADPAKPIATAAIYYNDDAGIAAMANATAWQRTWPALPARVESLVSVGLKDPIGRFYPGLKVGDRWF